MTDAPLIRRSPVPPDQCNLWKAFGLIGDRWTLVILRSALYGVRRFDDFQVELEIPRSVLSNRLAGLVELGIMERREYREDGQRARVEYPLTDMGRALSLPFMAMTEWSDHWIGKGTSPLTLRSKTSGQRLRVAMVDEDGKPARKDDIEPVIILPPRRPAKAGKQEK
ncbi:MAG: helix-turn-helix transcriptional regulator [Xanthobacteraceae bacterium]|nr:helix-turn-helix transcriptional regulator [Xanthobacteraceae bacterium]